MIEFFSRDYVERIRTINQFYKGGREIYVIGYNFFSDVKEKQK